MSVEVRNVQHSRSSQRRETHLGNSKKVKGRQRGQGSPGDQEHMHSLPKGWPACCRGPGHPAGHEGLTGGCVLWVERHSLGLEQ